MSARILASMRWIKRRAHPCAKRVCHNQDRVFELHGVGRQSFEKYRLRSCRAMMARRSTRSRVPGWLFPEFRTSQSQTYCVAVIWADSGVFGLPAHRWQRLGYDELSLLGPWFSGKFSAHKKAIHPNKWKMAACIQPDWLLFFNLGHEWPQSFR